MSERVGKWLVTATTALVLAACGGGDGEEVTLPPPAQLCASVGLQPKIFNGSTCAEPNRSPVVQLLMLQGGETFGCSGVLLTPTQVLTAAHCLGPATQRVAAVLWDAGGGSNRAVNAASWVNHPGYSESSSSIVNDVAIVNLSEAMPNPTMALLVSDASRKGNQIYMAGWGVPGNDLAVGYAQLSGVTAEHLKVSFKGKLSNTCPGDSGGPAYRDVGGRQGVVGVTSTGTTRACGAADESLFTNTQSAEVLGFIRSQVPGAAEI